MRSDDDSPHDGATRWCYRTHAHGWCVDIWSQMDEIVMRRIAPEVKELQGSWLSRPSAMAAVYPGTGAQYVGSG